MVKIKVIKLMNDNIKNIQEVIDYELPEYFNSHDFIEKFTRKIETEFVKLLCQYDKDAHRKVNMQIAGYLSRNKGFLNIEKVGKENSKNVFGNTDLIKHWRNLNHKKE